jgi:hypothetical protein
MSWRGARRRAERRLRRRLGLPVLSRRAALLVLLGFLGLALGATVLPDFLAALARYRVNQYEPKDFQREEHLEQSKGRQGSP